MAKSIISPNGKWIPATKIKSLGNLHDFFFIARIDRERIYKCHVHCSHPCLASTHIRSIETCKLIVILWILFIIFGAARCVCSCIYCTNSVYVAYINWNTSIHLFQRARDINIFISQSFPCVYMKTTISSPAQKHHRIKVTCFFLYIYFVAMFFFFSFKSIAVLKWYTTQKI